MFLNFSDTPQTMIIPFPSTATFREQVDAAGRPAPLDLSGADVGHSGGDGVRQNGPDALMPVDRQNGEPGRRRPDCALTFPVRLLCASVSDLLTSDELEDAVAHGMGRAFSRARRELPAADVLGNGVVLKPPELVKGKLPPQEEAELLARLSRAIKRAAQSQAVTAGVRWAIAATSHHPPPSAGDPPAVQPHQGFAGPAQDAPDSEAAAGIEGEYTISELRGAIRDAFPATGGTPRPGIFYGIYGRLRGAGGLA